MGFKEALRAFIEEYKDDDVAGDTPAGDTPADDAPSDAEEVVEEVVAAADTRDARIAELEGQLAEATKQPSRATRPANASTRRKTDVDSMTLEERGKFAKEVPDPERHQGRRDQLGHCRSVVDVGR